MNLDDIRTGLTTTLRATGTRVYRSVPSTVEPPALIVEIGDGLYGQDLENVAIVNWTVLLVASRAGSDERAQALLDDHLSTGTDRSIPDAIDADQTLNGTVDTARVVGWAQPGQVTFGDHSYIGCEITIEAVAE